jgi:excisionase family DNA binding protein
MNILKAGRYYTVGELALKFNVSRMTINRWYKAGKIKPTMIGNLARFHEDDVNELWTLEILKSNT